MIRISIIKLIIKIDSMLKIKVILRINPKSKYMLNKGKWELSNYYTSKKIKRKESVGDKRYHNHYYASFVEKWVDFTFISHLRNIAIMYWYIRKQDQLFWLFGDKPPTLNFCSMWRFLWNSAWLVSSLN